MGASASKTHEVFTIAPTSTQPPAAPTEHASTPHTTVAAVHDTPGNNIANFSDTEDADAAPSSTATHLQVSETEQTPDAAGEDGALLEEPPVSAVIDLESGSAVASGTAGVGWDEPLTPIPATAPLGAATGVALLAGGADLVESTVTLIAYAPTKAGGETREVLHATVTPDAEAKLRAALGLSETVMVAVEVTEDQDQPHPYDTTHQLFAKLTKAMKQVNKAIKHGTVIDASTSAEILAWAEHLDEAKVAATGDAPMSSMLDHYRAALAPYVAAVHNDHAAGQKLPKLTDPWTMTVPVTLTKMIPAPPPATPAGVVPAVVRDATRLKPNYDASTATVCWDGKARTPAPGKEYAIDLGDGYQAVYRPYAAASTSDAAQLTLRGQLELIAPPGAGHGPELVRRLGQLHLVNRALTGGEGEWTYLQRNIAAQGLAGHPAVTVALAKAQGIEDAQMHILVGQRAHQAAGLNDTQLSRFAAQLTLDAEAAALPDKVRLLRAGVATATGHADGDALAASPAYQPTPSVERGWLTWSRFDATDNPAVTKAWAGRRLGHRITAGNLYDVVTSGVLASTERRQLMGIGGLSTMSPEADKHSGGATSVFLRVQAAGAATGSSTIIWDNPTALIRRADWYAYNGDAFGAAPDKASSYGSGSTYTTNPLTAAKHDKSNNEIMFRHGIDLLHGPGAPSRIICATPAERDKIRHALTARGITHIGTRPVGDVITC